MVSDSAKVSIACNPKRPYRFLFKRVFAISGQAWRARPYSCRAISPEFRVLGIMVTGHMAPSSMAIRLNPSNMMNNPSFVPLLGVRAYVAFPRAKSFCTAYQERKVLSLRGGAAVQFSGPSTLSARGDYGGLAHRMRRFSMVAAASKKFVYPPMTSKPRWWWRTLACIPYLLPLHLPFYYAEHVYKLYPFVENFGFLADPFFVTMSWLPNWFMWMVSCVVHLWMVRRKELPHFLRFHIVMSKLLTVVLRITADVCGWMPGVVCKGRMSYIWMAVVFVEMFMALDCMCCSLCGMYSNVPFFSDAVYIELSR